MEQIRFFVFHSDKRMSLTCAVSETRPVIGRNSPILPTHVHLASPLGDAVGFSRRSLATVNYNNNATLRRWSLDDTFSHFDTTPARDGRTDRRTPAGHSIYRASVVSRGKILQDTLTNFSLVFLKIKLQYNSGIRCQAGSGLIARVP